MTEQEDFLDMFYEATIDIGEITDEEIKARCDEEYNEKDIELFAKAYRNLDNCKILVMKWERDNEEWYSLVSWKKEDDNLFCDYCFEAEKDPYCGIYEEGDRETFMQEWKDGEYSPDKQLIFEENELTNIRKAERTA